MGKALMNRTAEHWAHMAHDARKAAQACTAGGHFRSAVSRAYYAMFAAVTGLLIDQKVMPRAGLGTWAHERLPGIAKENLKAKLGDVPSQDVKRMLTYMYKLRLIADYVPGATVDGRDARDCLRYAMSVMRTLARDGNR